ncbi:MAG: MFS transporter [Planctomycetaceae bacterium]|nr:MFS transporter [Planctomycetaceae bacterium]
MPSEPTTPDSYALWRNPEYRCYAGSWFLITFSRRVEFFAVTIHLARMFNATQASFALGMIGVVQALPVMLLAIAGGHLADRFNRRNVMLATFVLGIFSAAGLLGVALLGGSVWWIYGLLAAGAVGWGLGNPARQALLPQLVPAKVFSNSVAWNSTVFYIATVTGPVVGGAIVGGLPGTGLAVAFALVTFCRVMAVAAIALIGDSRESSTDHSVTWESLVAGIRFVWNTKLILATITLDLFAVLFGGATYLLPVYAQHILHVGPTALGLLLSADAIGAICMAVLLANRPPLRRAGPALLWAVSGFGVAWIIFGLSQWFWLSLLMMFIIGALDNISVVVRHTLVQMLTPDEMRGRVSAVNGVFIVASNDLGGLESGLTSGLLGRMFGPALGPVISVVGGGVGTILVVLAAAKTWPQLLKIGSLASIRPATLEEPDRDVL